MNIKVPEFLKSPYVTCNPGNLLGTWPLFCRHTAETATIANFFSIKQRLLPLNWQASMTGKGFSSILALMFRKTRVQLNPNLTFRGWKPIELKKKIIQHSLRCESHCHVDMIEKSIIYDYYPKNLGPILKPFIHLASLDTKVIMQIYNETRNERLCLIFLRFIPL